MYKCWQIVLANKRMDRRTDKTCFTGSLHYAQVQQAKTILLVALLKLYSFSFFGIKYKLDQNTLL